MPVQVAPVALTAVPNSDTYVATIKSRRSATMQPQVDGNITRILVTSGQMVKAGQVLMQIDPLKQLATVQSQQGLEAQQKAVYQYNQADVERQRKLYEAGITSKQVYDQAVQSYQNSKGAFDSSAASTGTQRQQLAYYQIRAPFAGIVGDIPVHLGDYVSSTTLLTTLDENQQLEAYIYVPTERASLVHTGLAVDLIDTSGEVMAHSTISFVSPQVDNGLQSILAKAEIPAASKLRNQQIVNARVTWSTAPKPTVPVLSGEPDWRAGVCVYRSAEGKRVRRASGGGDAWGDGGEQLPRSRRAKPERSCDSFGAAVFAGGSSGDAIDRRPACEACCVDECCAEVFETGR